MGDVEFPTADQMRALSDEIRRRDMAKCRQAVLAEIMWTGKLGLCTCVIELRYPEFVDELIQKGFDVIKCPEQVAMPNEYRVSWRATLP